MKVILMIGLCVSCALYVFLQEQWRWPPVCRTRSAGLWRWRFTAHGARRWTSAGGGGRRAKKDEIENADEREDEP